MAETIASLNTKLLDESNERLIPTSFNNPIKACGKEKIANLKVLAKIVSLNN